MADTGSSPTRKRRFRWALAWLALSLLAAVVLSVQQQREEHRWRQQIALMELESLAQQLEIGLWAHAHALRGFAASIASLHGGLGSSGYYSELRRQTQGLLRVLLEQQPQWRTLTAVWRVNAYGDTDEVFIDDAEFGSNARGRFASVWVREGGALRSRVLSEEELAQWPQQAEARALDCAWRQQRLCAAIADAVLLAVPLLDEGVVQGVVGIEVDMELPAASARLADIAIETQSVDGRASAPESRLKAFWRAPDDSEWSLNAVAAPRTGLSWSLGWPALVLLMQLPLFWLYRPGR